MARSKPTSTRARPKGVLAFIRPNVIASTSSPPNAFELPLRTSMDIDTESPLHQLEGDPPCEDGRTPVNDQFGGSQPTSNSATEPSCSLARLERQRRLSTVLTPNTSETTNSERGALSSRATSNLIGHQRRVHRNSHSGPVEHFPVSIDENLAGQGRWMPSHFEPMQDVEFVSGTPSQELRLPQSNSPWSGFPRTDEGQSGGASPRERRGGRKGGFEKEKAVKVGEMRQIKACLRCWFYRIECDEGEPCAQCRRRMRTWNLPCSRERLPERLHYLLPSILTTPLEFERVLTFISTHTESYLPGQSAFHLPLTQYLDTGEEEAEPQQKYLWLQVREAEPLGPKLLRKRAFSGVDTEAGPVCQEVELEAPVLVPYIQPGKHQELEKDVNDIFKRWLLQFLERDSRWEWYVFPRGKEHAWQRNVLGQICRLLNPEYTEHADLEVAMELTFFVHLLTHSFVVPEEQIKWLYTQKLQHPQFRNRVPADGVTVAPRPVNMYLGMIVLNKVRLQANATLEHLNKLFASRDDSILVCTLAFCESFLFLMVLAQLQRSVMEHAILGKEVYDEAITVQEAKRLITEMEDELATPIIELCVYKLRKISKKRKAPASMAIPEDGVAEADRMPTRFFDNLRAITEQSGRSIWCSGCHKYAKQQAVNSRVLSSQTNLGEIDEKSFGVRNIQRLLKRLYDAVLPFVPSAGPSDVVLETEWPG